MVFSLTNLLWVVIPTLLAATIHSVTGFGMGIVLMIFLPMVFSIGQSAALGASLAILSTSLLFFQYRKAANLKLLVVPLIFYFPAFFAALSLAVRVQSDFLKPVLGIIFLGLAVYFIFFSGTFTLQANIQTALICTMLNAIVDAFFSIGGPFIVIYLLAATKTKEEYLGTLQAYFMICAIYGVTMRILKHQITPSMLPLIAAGMIALIIGIFLGSKVVKHIDAQMMRKLVYGFIGVAGIITFLSSLPTLFAILSLY
ncbi:sulfite exporter TauE/SafE family protein [Dehalobacterium formicoaceticum]|uniref:Probable membrane transporter protein n=1 Tax=Dehalobacterium formicoaceticum TaxID=51515 RepID=A0ABT1Y5A9_9FIRM|nr:sulfite exporter TauE/SafE family protein [Dehalobacterium formicoaceticum]MCR6546058.1 sulfite exporter TauE/SafE family protein [Dehalobacterium formicoaceticum]